MVNTQVNTWLGIYHSRYLPEKFDRKLKLVNTLGIYFWVFTLRFLL